MGTLFRRVTPKDTAEKTAKHTAEKGRDLQKEIKEIKQPVKGR